MRILREILAVCLFVVYELFSTAIVCICNFAMYMYIVQIVVARAHAESSCVPKACVIANLYYPRLGGLLFATITLLVLSMSGHVKGHAYHFKTQ